MKYVYFYCLFIFFIKANYGQTPTVGLLYHDSSAQAGYVLLTPEKSSDVYLLNACGQEVNYWATSTKTLVAYLLKPWRQNKDYLVYKDFFL